MTPDTPSTKGQSVAYSAARFALGGVIGCLTLGVTLPGGGPLAVLAPPLAFFAGAFWAAGELRLGIRGRFGFGVATTLATSGSFVASMGLQVRGYENLFINLVIPVLMVNATCSALGLLVIFPGEAKAYKYAVLGFTVASLVTAVIAAETLGTDLFNGYTGLVMLPIPGIAGGTAATWALRKG